MYYKYTHNVMFSNKEETGLGIYCKEWVYKISLESVTRASSVSCGNEDVFINLI
jgi:hypothetical protein